MQVGPPASDTAEAAPSNAVGPQRILMLGGACLTDLVAALAFINKLKRGHRRLVKTANVDAPDV